MKRTIKISSCYSLLPLVAALSLPVTAEAGELIGGVYSRGNSGYVGTSNSMTEAQQRSGNPLDNNSYPALIEASYHGQNYYSYESAKLRYKKALRNYREQKFGESFGSFAAPASGQYAADNVEYWIGMEPPSGYPRVQRANYTTGSDRVATVVPARLTSQQRVERAPAKTTEVAVLPQKQAVSVARVEESSNVERQNELSFLSDKERKDVSSSESSKKSLWSHFQRALLGS